MDCITSFGIGLLTEKWFQGQLNIRRYDHTFIIIAGTILIYPVAELTRRLECSDRVTLAAKCLLFAPLAFNILGEAKDSLVRFYYGGTNDYHSAIYGSNGPNGLQWNFEGVNGGCPQNRGINYCPIHPEVVDYIVDSGKSVTELCAGNGDNAVALRDQGVTVHSYDINPIIDRDVRYGCCGQVENDHNDQILLLCTAMESLTSVKAFKGDTLIIGGYALGAGDGREDKEYITSFSQPIPQKALQAMKLEIRPAYHEIIGLGWTFEKAFFGCRTPTNPSQCDCFYIFTRHSVLEEAKGDEEVWGE